MTYSLGVSSLGPMATFSSRRLGPVSIEPAGRAPTRASRREGGRRGEAPEQNDQRRQQSRVGYSHDALAEPLAGLDVLFELLLTLPDIFLDRIAGLPLKGLQLVQNLALPVAQSMRAGLRPP